jgi:uncharacterized protein (DUF427 family)
MFDPRPKPDPIGVGQESVWDYPRPPRVELSTDLVEVVFGGVTIVSTRRAVRVLETSHPPTYYLPFDDIAMEYFSPGRAGGSFCEWKGMASYLTLTRGFESIASCLALYPGQMDECRVNGEVVRPQEGGFYGGWITDRVVGPFKGSPGSRGW